MRKVAVPGAWHIFHVILMILEKYISIYESVKEYNNNYKL